MGEHSGQRRAVDPTENAGPGIERNGHVWTVRSLAIAKQVLQARGYTTQAGFTAEAIPSGYTRHHPLLVSDDPVHDTQRRNVGRYFAPKAVTEKYTEVMYAAATRLLDHARQAGTINLDDLALHYSVEVTRRAVGLEYSSIEGLSKRLVSFFNQPPFDITRTDLGRTRRQWALSAINALVPIARLYLRDVRPAVRELRRHPADNVISHLISKGYGDIDILIECMTFGTAGMVTTREFITMAAWHLLDDQALRTRYLDADTSTRFRILEEIIRLEPVVGHLYRRVRAPLAVHDGDRYWHLSQGELVDIYVRETNTDPETMGEHAYDLCPQRQTSRPADATGLSFSAGAHKCPGQALALTETEVLLSALLSHDPRLEAAPRLGWEQLVAGYTLRRMRVSLPGDRTDATDG